MKLFPKLVCFLGVAVLATAVWAEDESVTAALAKAPAAVQKTVRAQIAGGTLTEFSATNEAEETVYDATRTDAKGEERDFTVAQDGTLEQVEVSWAETPPAVQRIIRARVSGWELAAVDKILDEPTVSYSVDATKEGTESDFTVSEEGVLLSVTLALTNAPAAVQKTIQEQVGEGQLAGLEEIFSDEGNTYEVTVTSAAGREHAFTVTATGVLASQQVSLEKVPVKARNTIIREMGEGTILRIDKALVERKDGVLPFQVEGRKNGQPFDFSVGPRGRFLGMDE